MPMFNNSNLASIGDLVKVAAENLTGLTDERAFWRGKIVGFPHGAKGHPVVARVEWNDGFTSHILTSNLNERSAFEPFK